MNEAETRAELIDPKLRACGWGVVEGSKVLREYRITEGNIQSGGGRGSKIIADYILVHKGVKLAVIEAKAHYRKSVKVSCKPSSMPKNCNWKPPTAPTAKPFIKSA